MSRNGTVGRNDWNGVVPDLSRCWYLCIAALLLGAFLVQAVTSMRVKSVTFDETTHIASGYAALRTGDLRLNPQHPPLLKLIAALPLLVVDPGLDLEDPAWSQVPPDEWAFGRRFLFGNDADRVLFWARFPVVLLGLVLCCYVLVWARQLWGPQAGLLALVLAAGCPTLIAHSRLVTMDLALSCFSLMCCYHLRRFLASGSYRQLVAAAAGLGAALASKFSAVVLVPVVAVLVLLVLLRPAGTFVAGEASIAARGRRMVRPALILCLVVVAVVWASYRFPTNPGFYFQGLQLVNQDHSAAYASYLNGELKLGGWWYYFIAAFLYKTRASVLLLAAATLVLLRRTASRPLLDELFLLVPPLLLLLVTSVLAANIGVRYVLPVYPFLFIGLGRIASIRRKGAVPAVVLGLVLLAGVVETATIHPHHLSYFNVLVGGPANGHRLLDDSNIDWGQDLPALAVVMAEHGIDRVTLLSPWLGSTSPEHYLSCTRAPVELLAAASPPPGIYAVSTHLLIRGELWARAEGVPSDWLSRYTPLARAGYSIYLFKHPQNRSSSPSGSLSTQSSVKPKP